MANAILTPTAVTREALRILHQKLNFIGTINRQYDSSFAKSGAKIGDTLKIRLPNEYTVRDGAVLAAQDTSEISVDLTVATQKGVDVNFSSEELTMDLDDFSERILDPAMSVLAARMESDAMGMYKDVYNQVSDIGQVITLRDVLDGAKILTDNLAPVSTRCLNMNTTDNVELVDALKGLFNDPAKISKNFRDGMVANDFVGYSKVYQNTLWPSHTAGTATNTYLVNGASQTGSTLVVDTGLTTFTDGDIITIAGVFRVHPETKLSTGVLQKFVVTAAAGPSATSLSISPAIAVTGGRQNVNASPADNAVITKVGAASATHSISMGYHKDAFAFATADLIMPKGVDFSSRDVLDGLSMRIVRQYDINNDKFPCRLDVLYGFKAIRPQLACRYAFNT